MNDTELDGLEMDGLEHRYHELKQRLADLGFVLPGSIIERYTRCGAEGCRCHTDPTRRHGPYLQYTRKIAGKTITRRLAPDQAQHYRDWIANRRTLDQITTDMDTISQRAADLLLTRPTAD